MTTATKTATFGDLLRRSRKATGLSQAELAERAGLSVRGISDLERGARRFPRKDTVVLLADALELAGEERAAFLAAAHRVPPIAKTDTTSRLNHPAHNLPIQPTPLLGREREVAALDALLRRDDVRLVTLTGPGGVGKTRLAQRVATELADAFGDGVWLVRLSRLTDPALVVPTIAQTLGLREAGSQPIEAVLREWLRSRSVLLLLDNFEHVATAAPRVTDLLATSLGLKVMVTSRMNLRLQGEHEVPVAPLALPVEGGAYSPAVMLFVQRAQASRPDFRMTAATAPTVAAICERLDGLPLAIELAAPRVKLLPPAHLLKRLDRQLPLLTGGARDVEERQQTMSATLQWSYDLLSPEERQLFRRLAVFVGGCTLEAAEAVCVAPGVAEPLGVDVLEGLSRLVDHTLVQQREEVGESRFGMLHVIREYALEQLQASGETEALRQAHFDYYLAMAEEAETHLFAGEQLEWLDHLEGEHDNLRAAMGWALERSKAEQGLRLAGALWPLWHLHSRYREGRRWLESLLALGAHIPAPVRARAHLGLGVLAYQLSDSVGATATLAEGIGLLRGRPSDRVAGLTLFYLGWADQILRNSGERAQPAFEEALSVGSRAHDDYVTGLALLGLGEAALDKAEWKSAERLHEDSLALLRLVGERYALSFALTNYASVFLGRKCPGDLEQCVALSEQGLVVAGELGCRDIEVLALQNLGIALCDLGDTRRARPVLEQALALAREVGHRMGSWFSLRWLGRVALLDGDYDGARARFEESLALAREVHSDWAMAVSRQHLAMVYLDIGDHDRARPLLEASTVALRTYGDRKYLLLDCLRELAGLAAAQGQAREAARLLAAAEHLHEQLGYGIPPADRPRYERRFAALREQLDDGAFAAAVTEGRTLSLEEAIAEALGEER